MSGSGCFSLTEHNKAADLDRQADGARAAAAMPGEVVTEFCRAATHVKDLPTVVGQLCTADISPAAISKLETVAAHHDTLASYGFIGAAVGGALLIGSVAWIYLKSR